MSHNILFIILDSCRGDKFFGEYKNSITPNIDKLIQKGTYFENTISASDATLLGISSIFTGIHSFKTGIRSTRFNKLDKHVSTFFQLFKKNKYNIFGNTPTVTETIGLLPEFDNKQSTYDYHFDLGNGLATKVIETLKKEVNEPWLYYVHANDLHFPINPPDEYKDEKFGDSNYEKMISAIDYWLGKIINKIDLENTLIVITADHGSYIQTVKIEDKIINFEPNANKQLKITKIGNKIPKFLNPLKKKIFDQIEKSNMETREKTIESLNLRPYQKRALLWQRGDIDKFLYDENIHVPFLIAGPGIPKNKTISQQVRHVDIFPTIAELVEVKLDFATDGISLLPLINGEDVDELPAYIESTPLVQKQTNDVVGIRTSEFKYFRDKDNAKKRIYLFNLKNDPFEEENIAEETPERILEMEKILEQILEQKNGDEGIEFDEDETRAIEEELKKLGYD